MYTLSSIDKDFQMAGTYTLESISVSFGSTTFNYGGTSGKALPANAPTFSVYSQTPTLSITARSNYLDSSHNSSQATVYFGTSEGNCGATNYHQPYVSITISNLGNANKALLTFSKEGGGDVHLYVNNGDIQSKKTPNYEWTGNGVCQRWVGYYQTATGNDQHTPAGTLVANTLTLTYGEKTDFQFTVGPITIKNPS